MKNFFLLIVILLIISNEIFSQYVPVNNIFTPNGSQVQDTRMFTGTDYTFTQPEIDQLRNDLFNNYDSAELVDLPSMKYNCHAYAWHVIEGGTKVWIGYSTYTAEDIYWTDYNIL